MHYKLFNLYVEDIMRNAGLEEAKAGIKIARRNINNLRYADGTTLMAESEEELPRDQTQVSHIAGAFFTVWTTREAWEYGSG